LSEGKKTSTPALLVGDTLYLYVWVLRPEFMSYTRHVADFTVGERRLRFFGHVMAQDHHPVIGASLQPPSHWRRLVDALIYQLAEGD